MTNLAMARKIVSDGVQVLGQPEFAGHAWNFGEKMWLFSEDEESALRGISARVEAYLEFPQPKRPLRIAVFGSPGSGKSTAVKAIQEELGKAREKAGKTGLHWLDLNLTQFSSTDELAHALVRGIVESVAASRIPFVFFDEFDAPYQGTPLGWLPWFLAPMQDAQFRADGTSVTLRKAIYVFAGGTATSLEDFGAGSQLEFKASKGPDFVSRLDGHLSVLGMNHETERELRRGLGIALALGELQKKTGKAYKLSDSLFDGLLNVGRYLYGQRSLESLVAMMAELAGGMELTRDLLPSDSFLVMQVDRGPLDPHTIGGLVGLSGGGGKEDPAPEMHTWQQIARALWVEGATLTYGGSDEPHTRNLLMALKELPRRLNKSGADIRMELFPTRPLSSATIPTEAKDRVTVIEVHPPSVLNVPEHVFRMRWLSGGRCRARVLVSGKTDNFVGRMPGVLEEAVVALALRQPLYVVGAHQGAAALVGRILGLSTRTDPAEKLPPLEIGASASPPCAAGSEHLFRPPGFGHLPITLDAALSFVAGHALGGPNWTWNGLTPEENRELFQLGPQDSDKIAGLIHKGLLACAAKMTPGRTLSR